MPTLEEASSSSGSRGQGGKSGGFRTIILFRAGARAFFVHGFAKSGQDNIRDDELAAFKMLAAELLNMTTRRSPG